MAKTKTTCLSFFCYKYFQVRVSTYYIISIFFLSLKAFSDKLRFVAKMTFCFKTQNIYTHICMSWHKHGHVLKENYQHLQRFYAAFTAWSLRITMQLLFVSICCWCMHVSWLARNLQNLLPCLLFFFLLLFRFLLCPFKFV